jgi:hypothetical protein
LPQAYSLHFFSHPLRRLLPRTIQEPHSNPNRNNCRNQQKAQLKLQRCKRACQTFLTDLRFISGYAAKSPDDKFHMPYQRKDLALDLVKVHDDRLSNLGGNKYFACVDMKGADGKIYDIDFFMVVKPGKLSVTETSVHKINGKALYNWRQEGGVWKKVQL